MVAVDRIVTGRHRENCFVVSDRSQALVIDPGADAQLILGHLEEKGLSPVAVLATHGHFDHIGAVTPVMERYGIPFLIHAADVPLMKRANLYALAIGGSPIRVPQPTRTVDTEAGTVSFGPFDVAWTLLPGHTPGSVSFRIGEHLFTGDILLPKGIGHSRLPGSDPAALGRSLRRLETEPPDTPLHPGHGPSSTIRDRFLELNQ